MSRLSVVGVAAAGAQGALARYVLGNWLATRLPSAFPLPTLIINLLGSMLLGFVVGYGIERGRLPEQWRLPVTAGFVGSFTTFSTWSVETVVLLEAGRWGFAAVNVGLSLALGLSAVWAGHRLARTAGRRAP
ncbi:CrcB protein [Symbiobacterium terraclitae]|uniref:Fluoride-specific ion channel FluC n=1 Tax=Symbiobacterium terraclitae TaxID=557451 RepID=A0ABS4JP71_9FIRM|nr:fluoride efflux transporter CrcB [Symbiobacterium terraclitae]MBP2017318.1 CrcB protein [Symbiobacterium terraclitae]